MTTYMVFDENYERYDKWYKENHLIALNEAKALKRSMREYTPQPCLEVGVGTGWFASRIDCTLGLDPSINMLQKARSRGIEAIQGVGERLPIRTGSLGSLVIIVTLCFAENPTLILRESHRSLRRNGIIVACIVPRDSEWGHYYIELAKRGHTFYSLARFYTVDEVKDLMETTGFHVEEVIGTLTFGPGEEPVPENPRPYTGDEGFACIRGVKKGG